MELKKLIIAFTVLLVVSCGVYSEIVVVSDPEVDFGRYKTYAWLPDNTDSADAPFNNEIIRNNLRNYFGQEMTVRGYSVDLENPELLLQVVITSKKTEKINYYPTRPIPYYYCSYYYCSTYYSPYPYDYYYRKHDTFCYAMGYCKENLKYVEGSITLNVIDRNSSKLIWAGTAKGDIYDPSYIKVNIHPAVKSIMRKYPIQPL